MQNFQENYLDQILSLQQIIPPELSFFLRKMSFTIHNKLNVSMNYIV